MDDPARDEEAGLPLAARQPRSSIPTILFISFMLFMLTSHNGDEFLARHQYQDALRSLTYQLSNYTSWMNGTGNDSEFSVPERETTLVPLLEAFRITGDILDARWSSYYPNITGFIHGHSEYHNITLPSLADRESLPWTSLAQDYMAESNMTEIVDRIGSWNWTASDKVALSVVEKMPSQSSGGMFVSDNIALVHGRIELSDANTLEDLRLEFEGVHFIANGTIFGFAEPPGRHIDIRLLPSLVPVSVRNETARLIEPELSARIDKLKKMIDDGVVDQETSNNDEPPLSTCPFTFFAQIDPVQVSERLMLELEEEIQRPTGIWTVKPPKLTIRGLLISKECGVMYEVNRTDGLRSKTFFRKVTTYAGSSAIVYLILLILYSRQAEHSRTPSGISRVSRWTFLSQATIDSVSFAGHITFAILAEGRPSLSLIAPAFLACILFVYEAQFSVLVHQIQLPEDAVPAPQPAPTTPNPTPNAAPPAPTGPNPSPSLPTAAATPILPTQVAQTTLPASQQSFFQFFIHHVRTDPQARLWVILFIFLTFIVRVILSPKMSMIFVFVTYTAMWLPQIVRSARKGRSSGLKTEYVVGTTLCRLYFALYFLVCPKNVLDVEPRNWAYLLAISVCLQALVVLLQELFGASFFLPQKYTAVKTYNYHPPMPLADSESPEQTLGDCAICMDAILVDPLRRRSKSLDEKGDRDSGESNDLSSTWKRKGKGVGASGGLLNVMQMGVGNASARKNYSLAPCHHLFHTDCLERWLAIKNICPQCRRPLPPL